MKDNPRYVIVDGKPEWVFDTEQNQDRLRIARSGRAEPYSTTSRSKRKSPRTRSEQQSRQPQQPERQQHQQQHHQQQQQQQQHAGASGPGEIDDLGRVSDYWKTAAGSLFLGSILFLVGALLMMAFTLYNNMVFVYAISALSLLYGILRLSLAYYVYKDAKTIRYHSRERASKPWAPAGYGWQPKAFYWGVFTFIMPPFVEYFPAAVYFYRRHSMTGVP